MKPRFSIIVPLYNAEKYLRRCLDSIKAQTFSDFECILVDDGSTDGSFSVCEAYVENDGRFRLFHQENSGVGAARQKGISEAYGIYSLHIDSDDTIDPAMLERVQLQINKADCDILFMNYYEITPKGRKIYRELRFPEKSVCEDGAPMSFDRDSVLSAILGGGVFRDIYGLLLSVIIYMKNIILFFRMTLFMEKIHSY
jgi:glycosyltransferase involved in cell wall biosynthesis